MSALREMDQVLWVAYCNDIMSALREKTILTSDCTSKPEFFSRNGLKTLPLKGYAIYLLDFS
jgi:hypothetical protein